MPSQFSTPKRSKAVPKRKAAKAIPKNAKGFAAAVRKVIRSTAEKKSYIAYGINNPIVTSVGGVPPTSVPLVPVLAQGTASNNRIGDDVRVVKAVINGHVNMLPFNGTTNVTTCNSLVKLWVVDSTTLTAVEGLGPGYWASLFDIGGGSAAWQGNINDIMFDMNTPFFKSKEERLLNMSYALPTVTGTTESVAPNNDGSFTKAFSIDFTKHLGRLTYSDATSNLCTNKGLWLFLQCVAADGSSTAVQNCEFHYNVRVDYIDL